MKKGIQSNRQSVKKALILNKTDAKRKRKQERQFFIDGRIKTTFTGTTESGSGPDYYKQSKVFGENGGK